MSETPTCPDCGVETDWYSNDEAYYCGPCSADKSRHEPGSNGCMGH